MIFSGCNKIKTNSFTIIIIAIIITNILSIFSFNLKIHLNTGMLVIQIKLSNLIKYVKVGLIK